MIAVEHNFDCPTGARERARNRERAGGGGEGGKGGVEREGERGGGRETEK